MEKVEFSLIEYLESEKQRLEADVLNSKNRIVLNENRLKCVVELLEEKKGRCRKE